MVNLGMKRLIHVLYAWAERGCSTEQPAKKILWLNDYVFINVAQHKAFKHNNKYSKVTTSSIHHIN